MSAQEEPAEGQSEDWPQPTDPVEQEPRVSSRQEAAAPSGQQSPEESESPPRRSTLAGWSFTVAYERRVKNHTWTCWMPCCMGNFCTLPSLLSEVNPEPACRTKRPGSAHCEQLAVVEEWVDTTVRESETCQGRSHATYEPLYPRPPPQFSSQT